MPLPTSKKIRAEALSIMSAVLRRCLAILFIALVSGLSFLAGYAAAQRPAVVAGSNPETASSSALPTTDLAGQFGLFWEAWSWVDREYLDRASIDPAKVTHGAIRGMIQSLGDPNSYFADPAQRVAVEGPLTGESNGVRVESVQAVLLPQGIGYIKIAQFGAKTGEELEQALQQLLESKPIALVLDLRGNPGGYLAAAVDVTSQFLADGVVLHELRRDGVARPFSVKKGGLATSDRLAVLVDRDSASASEIVAGALQDYGRAILVGERTYGKGSLQSVHVLSDGSSIHVTIAKWLTPKQRPINGNGLVPDVTADRPAQPGGEDPILDRAVQLLLADH